MRPRDIARRFVCVDGRRVHLRQAGRGPPLVMLHGSPGDSQMLTEEMAAASDRFTCLALDTPGFGESEPLPGEVLTVGQLAQATAAAMRALELPPCRVYGSHSGAAIALELALAAPEAVTGLVLEGLPVFTDDEIATLFTDYFAPFVADPLGGHLTAIWMRFRDQFTWFPWSSRDVRRLNPVDRPSPQAVDRWVSMYYRACRTYQPAYRAILGYGQGARTAAQTLSAPCVYTAAAEDMLFPHLDRLPPPKAGQRIERLVPGEDRCEAIAAFVASLPGDGDASPRPTVSEAAGRLLVDSEAGQVFARTFGDPASPAVILLHDAPGSALGVAGLAEALAGRRRVIAPDLPGSGASDAPEEASSVLEAGADAVTAVADALGLTEFVVAACGCGAAVAAVLAARGDERLRAVCLDALPSPPDEAAAAQIAPELPLSPDGGHWVRAWMMLRDGQIYAPWYDGRVAAQRADQGNFDADWLHDQTVALMRSRASYHRLPREAARFDAAAAFARARVSVHVAGDGELAGLILSLQPPVESLPCPT